MIDISEPTMRAAMQKCLDMIDSLNTDLSDELANAIDNGDPLMPRATATALAHCGNALIALRAGYTALYESKRST